jgi:hypothetical protein
VNQRIPLTAADFAELRQLVVDTNRGRTHWEHCWRYHTACGLLRVLDDLVPVKLDDPVAGKATRVKRSDFTHGTHTFAPPPPQTPRPPKPIRTKPKLCGYCGEDHSRYTDEWKFPGYAKRLKSGVVE